MIGLVRGVVLKSIVVLGLSVLLNGCALNDTDLVFQKIEAANELYRQEKPDLALEAYREILSLGHISAGLYYNLASAAFQTGDRSAALVALEIARDLAPRDPEIIANRNFVLSGNRSLTDARWGSWHDSIPGVSLFSEREFFIFSSGSLTLLLLAIILKKVMSRSNIRKLKSILIWTQIIFVVAFGYGLLGFLTLRDAIAKGGRAFVVVDATQLRSDASEASLSLYQIPRDTQLRVLESVLPISKDVSPDTVLGNQAKSSAELWYRVIAPGGLSGWVSSQSLVVF